jgi:hypothetical protein
MRVDELRYFYHWLFPLKVAVRVKEACLPSKPQPPDVPAPRVNQFLYGISRIEQRVCGPHGLPFGSSLLAVGGRQSIVTPWQRSDANPGERVGVTSQSS